MSATLKQIGDRVGVTSVTVSRALRGIGRMRPETRAAIRKVARELGHHRTNGVLAASIIRRSNPDWRPCIPRFHADRMSIAQGLFGRERQADALTHDDR